MAEAGQAARKDSGQAAVDPFDPLALAARLAEARERRAAALANRQADSAPDAAGEVPRRPPQRAPLLPGWPAAHPSVPKPATSPRPAARAHPGQKRSTPTVQPRARSGSLRAILVPAGIGLAAGVALGAAVVVAPPDLRRAIAELIAPEYLARPGAGDPSGRPDEAEEVATARVPVAPAPATAPPPASEAAPPAATAGPALGPAGPAGQARRSVSFEAAALKAPPSAASAPGGAAALEVPSGDAPPTAPAVAEERAPKRILQTIAVPAFRDPAMAAPRPVVGAEDLAMRAGRDARGGLREPPQAEAEPIPPPVVAILTEPADPVSPSPSPSPSPPTPERWPARAVVYSPPDAAAATSVTDLPSVGFGNAEAVPAGFAVSRTNVRFSHPGVQSGDRAETAEAWQLTGFRPPPAPGAVEAWPLGDAPAAPAAPAVSPRMPPAATPAQPRVAEAEPRGQRGASQARSRLNREVESMLKLEIRSIQRHR